MKRIILAGLCALFSVGLFAQKALIIHKTDGTKLEIPMESISGFGFSGKSVVNDDDYTKIAGLALHSGTELNITFSVLFNTDDPYLTMSEPVYGEDWGILYATSPDVTVENGALLQLTADQQLAVRNLSNATVEVLLGESKTFDNIASLETVDLDFETTYYVRSFVRRPANSGIYEETYFYSKEQSIYTDKPTMLYYGAHVNPALYAQGYVMPSDGAWVSLAERYPHLAVGGTCAEIFIEHWNEYLTSERIASLKPLCTTTYECCDGMLYLLDSISDDFARYAIDLYDDEFTTAGYSEDCKNTFDTLIECDASWNVSNNRYWEYKPSTPTARPNVIVKLSKPLLADYNYTIEVELAPDVTQTDTLPSKFRVRLEYTDEEGKIRTQTLGNNLLTNDQLGTIVTFDSLSVGGFGEASLEFSVIVTSREKEYSRSLRIAQIKAIPLGPKEEE